MRKKLLIIYFKNMNVTECMVKNYDINFEKNKIYYYESNITQDDNLDEISKIFLDGDVIYEN